MIPSYYASKATQNLNLGDRDKSAFHLRSHALTLGMLGNSSYFVLLSADFFKNQLFQIILSETLSEFHSVRPELAQDCLQRLSADNKSRR